MGDRLGEAGDDLHVEDEAEVLGAEILFRSGLGAGHQRPRLGAGADLGLLGRQGGGHLREEFLSDGGVDEQRLEGVAGAGALALRVEHDLFGHREVGLRVDVDVADAGVVLDDGDLGGVDHRLDEARAAAGDDDVDDAAEGSERRHGFAVGEGKQRNGFGG